ncbi:hypothetical protein IQ216_06240 [Cyanobium sp. LEGE 06143]|uniref:hypothetical protein n=1 Tax=Cyanobium sp. LEGE 06143 TaxID=945727 RepID=UPI0018801A2E|nr:hypothetical protein [Cyanobium sp. LEGE 06143]MBE9172699.1 hypothetical protein [Cyanobium sp. LEGE 06143]
MIPSQQSAYDNHHTRPSTTLEPVTNFPGHCKDISKDVIVYACDVRYLKKGIQFHLATKRYWHPKYQPIIFVLSDDHSRLELNSIKKKAESAGILLCTFTCPGLAIDDNTPANSQVLINYLKSARYSLAAMIMSKCSKEALENPSHPRENIPVIAGADWVHGQQAARIR